MLNRLTFWEETQHNQLIEKEKLLVFWGWLDEKSSLAFGIQRLCWILSDCVLLCKFLACSKKFQLSFTRNAVFFGNDVFDI